MVEHKKNYLKFISLFLPFLIILAILGAYMLKNPTERPKDMALHKGIVTTVFWVGEEASPANKFIPNDKSAWDIDWQENFGGVDDPDNRNGFFPAGFTPKENPFYFALPYNDLDKKGKKKSNVTNVVYWADESNFPNGQSMLKNRWIKIIKDGKTAYAQWEDVGPYGEDDFRYVFGKAKPKNKISPRAGLDVSPAVRDYLGLSGSDETDWQFVEEHEVPDGPWKIIVTTSNVNFG